MMNKFFKFLFLCLIIQLSSLYSAQGISYSHLETPNCPLLDFITCCQSVHILEVDPKVYNIRPVRALDNGIGRENVFSINERYGAIASINGGFFLMGGLLEGKPCGALKIHNWYSIQSNPRGCIGWSSKDQNPKIDRLLVKVNATDGKSNKFNIDGLNCQRDVGKIVLFNSCFHRTTLTKSDGEELVVVNGIIKSIVKGGSTKIPDNGYVLSIQNKHPLFNTFKVGKTLRFVTKITPMMGTTTSADWDSLEYILGVVPILLHHRIKNINFQDEGSKSTFLYFRHARTGVGILPNGNWLFVVVDKKNLFDGMTVPEFATLMTKLGCVDALNLDGGGSSTMVYEGVIKNSPRGDIVDEKIGEKAARKVSDAIIIIPKKMIR